MRKFVVLMVSIVHLVVVLRANEAKPSWSIAILPSSIRIDPSSHRIYDQPYESEVKGPGGSESLLKSNWVFNGREAYLQGARGEYVSFQLVVTNNGSSALKGIEVTMPAFKKGAFSLPVQPELFLEWSVEIKSESTGYPKSALGKGWYPDALIPFTQIQQGEKPKKVNAWVYPLQLPDFNNRIDNQKSLLIWVDQYIPFEKENAGVGEYTSSISVKIGTETQTIPVKLNLLDFAIPNENLLKASLQHEGFMSRMDEKQELEVYQLMKRNRVCIIDPTYEPDSKKVGNTMVIDWKRFDERLSKYLDGSAFTKKHGYDFGPGYATPLETFLLPFDVYGKHGTAGWPDVGKPDVEKNASNKAAYVKVIQSVRAHLKPMVDPRKTDLTVYLNGLDESYFPEAWDRMAYYGELFKKEYPEAEFRVDGGYNDSAMRVIEKSISSWAVHTIEFDEKKFSQYGKAGIKEWLYGPMIYESKVNSWVGSSTFTDLPLVNDRAISWSAWKYKAYSWISWGLGAGWKAGWYDPETWKSANDGGNADGYDEKKLNGNGMLIYSPGIVPNVKVACASIRLKTMRNGVQEYEYMRLLSSIDKNEDRVTRIVNRLIAKPFGNNSIGTVNVWSYDPRLWDEGRRELGLLIHEASKN